MPTTKWTPAPPQIHGKLVRLRYKNIDDNKIRQGLFSWSAIEKAFVQCSDPDGVALYVDDGWQIVSWQPFKQ